MILEIHRFLVHEKNLEVIIKKKCPKKPQLTEAATMLSRNKLATCRTAFVQHLIIRFCKNKICFLIIIPNNTKGKRRYKKIV